MFRRIIPFILLIVFILLDSAVIPVIVHNPYVVPLTLALVFAVAIRSGPIPGVLFGFIGGILLDITACTLAIMTLYFIGAGILCGLILNDPEDKNRRLPLRKRRKRRLRRALVVFALDMLGEMALLFFQYFNTETLMPIYFLNAAIRASIITVLTLLLHKAFEPLLKVDVKINTKSRIREAKNF